ncbi:hypothetical protein OT109_09070 [Phycisphaeraceae bacterium D3-23]
MKLLVAMLAMGVLSSGAAVGTAFACDGDEGVPETTVVVATEAAGECGGCDSTVEVVEKAGDCGGCDSATEVVVAEGDCEGCDSATEVVVAEGDCEGCDSATEVVVAEGDCEGCDSATEVVVAEGDCEGCDSATEVVVAEGDCEGCDSATEAVVAEGGCEGCETECDTCEVMTALEGVELSDHGKAVLALGQAGVPVWIDDAGFGMVDGKKVACPVAFSRAATQFIATMGAEAGCEVCQDVLATADSEASVEETAAKQAPVDAGE